MIRRPSPPWTAALLLAHAALGAAPLACGAGGRGEASDGGSTSTTDGAGLGGGGDPVDPAQAAVDEARERLPTYLDLHTQVIARTCTPNMGVCHNIKEYPDLHTPQTMLAAIDRPCNLDEEVALNVYNGCERQGDRVELIGPSNPGFVSEVGYVAEERDPGTGEVAAIALHIRDPIPGAMADPLALEGIRLSRATPTGPIAVGEVVGKVSYSAGATQLRIVDVAALTAEERALLDGGIAAGDPNQDGVYGGSVDPYRLILPGDPGRSYLLQRLLGAVPGSPMPLANQPLRAAEVVALACWIEGIDDPERIAVAAPINYDDCETAAKFGGGDPGSGHALSLDVQPILNERCAVAGCHSEAAAEAGLVLTPGRARAQLLADSTQVPGTPRVEAGNPTGSYLINKLTGTGTILGGTMPLGPGGAPERLEDWQIEVIRGWIVAGAPED